MDILVPCPGRPGRSISSTYGHSAREAAAPSLQTSLSVSCVLGSPGLVKAHVSPLLCFAASGPGQLSGHVELPTVP